MSRRVQRGSLAAAAVVALAAAGWGLTAAGVFADVARRDDPAHSYATMPTLANGRELVLVYIGAAACAWSNEERLPGLVERAKLAVRERAAAADMGFTAVGIAKDPAAADGLAHLQRFGAFDEVMAGRSWMNRGAQHYLIEGHPGPAVTPQIVVVERTVERGAAGSRIVAEQVLLRRIGTPLIEQWVEAGAPVPSSGRNPQTEGSTP